MIYIVYHIEVKYVDWDESKNKWLITHRGVSFEMCLMYIERGDILEILVNHPPYQHQKIFIINIEGYVYNVPYVEDEEKIFLKTIYPSRKSTKKYLP